MPLVRISLREGKSAAHRRAIADAVHRALVETIHIPPQDRFQLVTEHSADALIYDPSYLGIERTGDVVFVQIAPSAARSVELKKALYARMAALLAESAGLRPQDLFVNLVEVAKENWSFGDGIAQYA